jgi:signal transduction histidine kinase
MLMTFGTSGIALVLTCAAFVSYEFFTFRQSTVRELSTLGEVIATQSTGAVAFDNPRDAAEVLSALKAERHIVAAGLYDQRGKLFARYPANAPDADFPGSPLTDGYRFANGRLIGFTPLVQVEGSDRLGTLYLSSDLGAIYARIRLYGIIALLVITGSGTVAFFLSRTFQRQLARPILNLAATAKEVSRHKNYAVRAVRFSDDELGLLTEAFNHMLAQIEQQNATLEKAVRERTAELEAANFELEAFCSSAAHDLRTPLRAITGFTDMLLDPRAAKLAEQEKRFVLSIRAGSEQMGQLIEDLLSFSRVSRQDLARRSVSLESVCRDVIAELAPEMAPRKVELRIGAMPDVYGDPALMRIVMMNLLSNALKYSRSKNPAVVEVGVTVDVDKADPVVFVRDNGVGFDMKNADKLFGVFQRLHHAHEFEGNGVGLATVRRIVERHGGRIWANAEPGAGATFYFTIPSAEA